MKFSEQRLVVLDADGTTLNAFDAIEKTFSHHRMALGDLERFQKRHNIFKYLGGLKEFPSNLRKQINKIQRRALIDTLTQVYREEATLYNAMAAMIQRLIDEPRVRVGVVSRNITLEPVATLKYIYRRNGVDPDGFDFFVHLPLKQDKAGSFRDIRDRLNVNPACSYACGDERKDFSAALACGMHPFMVSYGFESFLRLERRIGVPRELISVSPEQLRDRLLHAVGVAGTRTASTAQPAERRFGLEAVG
jgi:phosphoglycolate phosphatase